MRNGRFINYRISRYILQKNHSGLKGLGVVREGFLLDLLDLPRDMSNQVLLFLLVVGRELLIVEEGFSPSIIMPYLHHKEDRYLSPLLGLISELDSDLFVI